MTIYMSGAISNDLENYKEKFFKAKMYLEGRGHKVVDPSMIKIEGEKWTEYMKIDLVKLLHCDAVALVDKEYIQSRGVDLECNIAKELGLPVKYFEDYKQC